MLIKLIPVLLLALPMQARESVAPEWPAELSDYILTPGPVAAEPLLRKGDRIAICGDSITEQKRYSVILETWLTACHPELETTCRQYGWSGEQAGEFLQRMENDVLRFKPTLATTCYGMNDFRYVPYDEAIAAIYRDHLIAIAKTFKKHGCRVILGSPGIIDSVPSWVKTAIGPKEKLNLALSKFRNIAAETAISEDTAFADIYQPMLLADYCAKRKFGGNFKVAGKDGVHPGWAGQVIMAHAFLKAMEADGDLGTITWDAAADKADAAGGHEAVACRAGRISLLSRRLPFSPGPGDAASDDSIRAGLELVPFDADFNRLTFRVSRPQAAFYQVTWGAASRRYSAGELARGVSLAKDFENHPLVPAFKAVWDAVVAKQTYETRQIKNLVHGPEGDADMEATFALTEKVLAKLEAAVRQSLKPVEHELLIEAVE